MPKKTAYLATAKRAARAGARPYQLVARTGYAARGLVYAIFGLVALSAAFGARKNALSLTGAFQELFRLPVGTPLLIVIALGMMCFGIWRVAQGLLDADHLGNGRQALWRRAAYTISSSAYFVLAAIAMDTIFESHASTFNSSPRSWAAWLMSWPLGSWALGLVGVVVLAIAVGVALRAWRAPFKEDLSIRPSVKNWIVVLGRAGHAVRSLLFFLVGYFLIASALHSNTAEVRDTGGALNVLQGGYFGMVVYTSAAVGLVLFGIFEVLQAVVRKFGRR